ncbi:MAG: glycosyltransferase [Vicinamibacterales bacterium]|nr:glycosyltransferase [Vicinamibacterales bacterium]
MTAALPRRRICFVLPSLAGGGAERAAVQILNGLDGDVWDRTMYLFSREGPYLGDVDAGVTVASGARASRLGRWLDLRRSLRASRPEIVVAFLSYFTVLTAARAAGVGTRVVFNQQTPLSAFLDDADYGWRGRGAQALFTTVARWAYAAADLVIATSTGVADDLRQRLGVDATKLRVIPNPVDLDAVRAGATEPLDPAHAAAWRAPVIVAAGRLAEAKNYPLLIEALALVRERVPATLFVLGQGDQASALQALARARGVEDAIVWCGFQSNPWKYMARADVFALTSRYEGFGNVLVEAMACGVPVVATASPGTRDIVEDGVSGRLVEAHTAEAVAEGLLAVLTDPAAQGQLAEGARHSSEKYGRDPVASRYGAVLQEARA